MPDFIMNGFVWTKLAALESKSAQYYRKTIIYCAESTCDDKLYIHNNIDHNGFSLDYNWCIEFADPDSFNLLSAKLYDEHHIAELYTLKPELLSLGPCYLESSYDVNIRDLFDRYSSVNSAEIKIRKAASDLIRMMRTPEIESDFNVDI